jgi:hypothetical protein
MQPRIYVYKITFQESPLYYIGVHKEKTFNEEYMGSPITHKEKWQIYTPQKEILREFDYTDDGWLQAQDFEKELIRPVYNTDINCLNEHCGGRISLAVCREAGKKTNVNRTPEQRSASARKREACKTPQQRSAEARKANATRTPEQRSASARKREACKTPQQRSAAARKANATRTPQQRSAAARKANATRTPQQRSAASRKGRMKQLANMTPEQRSVAFRNVRETKFQCTVTGYISTAGPLAQYQRARGIDTSNRVKVISSLATS